jgi:hypothetical protein
MRLIVFSFGAAWLAAVACSSGASKPDGTGGGGGAIGAAGAAGTAGPGGTANAGGMANTGGTANTGGVIGSGAGGLPCSNSNPSCSLTVCSAGGTGGQATDAGPVCRQVPSYCAGEAHCEPCGEPGLVCCPGGSCAMGCCIDGLCADEGAQCGDSDGVCSAGACTGCGSVDRQCCPGAAGSRCTGDLACVAPENRCRSCGEVGEPCCYLGVCHDDAGASCDISGICRAH